MGDPRKARKTYATPRHPWRKEQLEEELRLLGEYGLRNKRELRHQETMLSEIRGIARTLLGAPEEQRARLETQYLGRLARLGLLSESASVDNILDLNVKDLMERRLQTIVFKSGLSRTIHQARQFVTHGHVSIAGQIVSVPGYFVKRDEESRVAFHARSALNNAQHPAVPAGPVLPDVPPEIKAIVQTEQPIEILEPEEETPAETEDKQP